jgi:ribosome-associated heat shock protein Hsp15
MADRENQDIELATDQPSDSPGKLRIDRWLWFARFFKTRSLASRLSGGRKIRVDGNIISKASQTVSVGNVLTFPQGRIIRTVKILALGDRRGPATEAQALYEDLAPPEENGPLSKKRGPLEGSPAKREPGAGRPTKAERRAMDKFLADDNLG